MLIINYLDEVEIRSMLMFENDEIVNRNETIHIFVLVLEVLLTELSLYDIDDDIDETETVPEEMVEIDDDDDILLAILVCQDDEYDIIDSHDEYEVDVELEDDDEPGQYDSHRLAIQNEFEYDDNDIVVGFFVHDAYFERDETDDNYIDKRHDDDFQNTVDDDEVHRQMIVVDVAE